MAEAIYHKDKHAEELLKYFQFLFAHEDLHQINDDK